MSSDASLRLYAENAKVLTEKWAKLAPTEVLAPVADLLPKAPCRIADVGAGSGHNATWLASLGYAVTAAEPVQEFRKMADAEHSQTGVEWLDDALPYLIQLRIKRPFDAALLSGVWHHVAPDLRAPAMQSLATLLRTGGLLFMSLRHGQVDPSRGLYEVNADEALTLASDAGCEVIAQRKTGSIQQHNRDAGVHWTWLVLQRS